MKLSFFILSILLILVALMHANADASETVIVAGQTAAHVQGSVQSVAQLP